MEGTVSVNKSQTSLKKAYLYVSGEERMRFYRGAGKSLARPTSHCILFDGKNISFDASLVVYRNSINLLAPEFGIQILAHPVCKM